MVLTQIYYKAKSGNGCLINYDTECTSRPSVGSQRINSLYDSVYSAFFLLTKALWHESKLIKVQLCQIITLLKPYCAKNVHKWESKSDFIMVHTLCIVIDQTPISTFCFIVDLSENHLSYVNKWYLIFLPLMLALKYRKLSCVSLLGTVTQPF